MVEAELAHHRALAQTQLDSVMTFLEHSEKIVDRFKMNNNGLQHNSGQRVEEAETGDRIAPFPAWRPSVSHLVFSSCVLVSLCGL
jgi:hypothetical protein